MKVVIEHKDGDSMIRCGRFEIKNGTLWCGNVMVELTAKDLSALYEVLRVMFEGQEEEQ